MYVTNGLKKTGLVTALTAGLFAAGCATPPSRVQGAYERVISDSIIPEHNAATLPNERDGVIYIVKTRSADGTVNTYEFSDVESKATQALANDVDIGDEIRFNRRQRVINGWFSNTVEELPTRLSDIDIRDLYITGYVAGKKATYYRNSAGVFTKGELEVTLIDLNGKEVALKYESHPQSIAAAYKLLGPAPSVREAPVQAPVAPVGPAVPGQPEQKAIVTESASKNIEITNGRLVKLPRASTDIAAALYDP